MSKLVLVIDDDLELGSLIQQVLKPLNLVVY